MFRMSDTTDEKYRKLFIGGLHPNTDDDALREFYSQWGVLTDCVVMRDAHSGKSRKFGFVTYESSEMVDKAQENRPHVIHNKTVESKRAMPRSEASNTEVHQTVKRIFVRGLKDLTEKDLEDHFAQYGNVENVEIIKNKETGKSKGFGFVTFDDYDPVDKVQLYEHDVNGVRLHTKKALSKEETRQMNTKYQRNGGGGGFGYGSGPYNGSGGGDWGAGHSSSSQYDSSNWGSYPSSDRDFGGYGNRAWNRSSGWGGNEGDHSSDWYSGDDRRSGGPMRGGRDFNRRGPYSRGSRGRGGGRGSRGGR